MGHKYTYLDIRINYRELANRLKAFRGQHGLTQEEAGEVIGLNPKIVAGVERCALRRNAGKPMMYGNDMHLEMANFLKIVNTLYHDKGLEELLTIFEVE